MTSTNIVHSEIDRFLENSDPEVLCITGKWGVGKTFAWKKFVRKAQRENRIKLKRYAYVSLFGQNSLNDLKSSIFEETVDVGEIDKPFDLRTTALSVKAARNFFPRLLTRFGPVIPGLREYLGGAGRLLFLAVRNQLVCVDDLERAGDGLKAKDVLGLISFLKEDRGCKVVMLLNEEELESEDKEIFFTHLEKVADIKLEFRPTAAEAANIAIKRDTPVAALLAADCVALGITNIRVIAKIERLAIRLAALLSEFHPNVLKQAVHSVALFGWSAYQRKDAPSLDFISNYNSWASIVVEKNDVPEGEKLWRAVLRNYNFTEVDAFDRVILAGVKCGFFDPDALIDAVMKLQTRLERLDQDETFTKAWRRYHSSFKSTADEVLDGLYAAFRSSVESITPANAAATITLFKDFDRTSQAQELLDYYLDRRANEDAKFFDLSQGMFAGEIKDDSVKKAFAKMAVAKKRVIDPKSVLLGISQNNGWHTDDIDDLAKLDVEDFVKLFRETEGTELPLIIKAGLSLGTYGGASTSMDIITQNVSNALRLIGAESAINARRVAYYGITPATKPLV